MLVSVENFGFKILAKFDAHKITLIRMTSKREKQEGCEKS